MLRAVFMVGSGCGALVEAIKHLLFIQVNTWGIEGNKKPAEAG